MGNRTGLIRITAPHFCAGVQVSLPNLGVTETAPILRYMKGWTVFEVENYCDKKGWTYEYRTIHLPLVKGGSYAGT